MIPEAPHDFFSSVEMSFPVRRKVTACRIKGPAFTQADQCIEQPAVFGPRAANVSTCNNGNATGFRHSDCTATGLLDSTIEKMRDVDGESVAKNVFGPFEQAGIKAFVSSEEDAPMPGFRSELVPFDADPTTGACILCFEPFVPA